MRCQCESALHAHGGESCDRTAQARYSIDMDAVRMGTWALCQRCHDSYAVTSGFKLTPVPPGVLSAPRILPPEVKCEHDSLPEPHLCLDLPATRQPDEAILALIAADLPSWEAMLGLEHAVYRLRSIRDTLQYDQQRIRRKTQSHAPALMIQALSYNR